MKENVDSHTRITRSSDIEFLIKWRGFGEKWNTWEPYRNVRLNEVVHEYLRNNKLKRFIPRVLETDPVVNYIVSFSVVNHTVSFITDNLLSQESLLLDNSAIPSYLQQKESGRKCQIHGRVMRDCLRNKKIRRRREGNESKRSIKIKFTSNTV